MPFLLAAFLPVKAIAGTTAHVDQPMATAMIVNIFWDSNWDADNPNLMQKKIDAVTAAVVQSSYLGGLAEYGVKTVTFSPGFLPNKACPSVAPSSVGFYDPVNTSIAGFIQCEHDNEPFLQQNNIIYNVILPQGSLESDFWSANFCSGPGSKAAWHYHGLQKISIIPANLPFADGPVYTILQTNPKCLSSTADFFRLLTHEVVESLTDPFPIDISIIPPHVQVSTENEIADICEPGASATNSGAPPAFMDQNGNSPNQAADLTTYWSNAKQSCVSFTDSTLPAISGLTLLNFGQNLFLLLSGTGFGTWANTPGLLTLNDNTDGWQAGNAIDQNAIQFSTTAWATNQVLELGLTNLASNPVSPVGASLTVWVCNQQTLRCASSTASAPANSPAAKFAIRTQNGDFFTAINGGGQGGADTGSKWALHTDASTIGAWEKFHVIANANGGFTLVTSGTPFLPGAFFPRLITAVDGGGIGAKADPTNAWPIHTDTSTVGAWEQFSILPNPDGTVSLGTPDGTHFVTAVSGGGIGATSDPSNSLPIHTDAITPGTWENLGFVPQH
jgi:hypothetical protein